MLKCVQKESAVTIRSASHLDDSCAGQVFFAGAGVEQYMWPGGRICSNCALARKRSAQSASTAWIFTGGQWKTGGLLYRVRAGGALREGVMSQEHSVLYYFGTTRTWHLPFYEENQTWT